MSNKKQNTLPPDFGKNLNGFTRCILVITENVIITNKVKLVCEMKKNAWLIICFRYGMQSERDTR